MQEQGDTQGLEHSWEREGKQELEQGRMMVGIRGG